MIKKRSKCTFFVGLLKPINNDVTCVLSAKFSTQVFRKLGKVRMFLSFKDKIKLFSRENFRPLKGIKPSLNIKSLKENLFFILNSFSVEDMNIFRADAISEGVTTIIWDGYINRCARTRGEYNYMQRQEILLVPSEYLKDPTLIFDNYDISISSDKFTYIVNPRKMDQYENMLPSEIMSSLTRQFKRYTDTDGKFDFEAELSNHQIYFPVENSAIGEWCDPKLKRINKNSLYLESDSNSESETSSKISRKSKSVVKKKKDKKTLPVSDEVKSKRAKKNVLNDDISSKSKKKTGKSTINLDSKSLDNLANNSLKPKTRTKIKNKSKSDVKDFVNGEVESLVPIKTNKKKIKKLQLESENDLINDSNDSVVTDLEDNSNFKSKSKSSKLSKSKSNDKNVYESEDEDNSILNSKLKVKKKVIKKKAKKEIRAEEFDQPSEEDSINIKNNKNKSSIKKKKKPFMKKGEFSDDEYDKD